MAPPTAASSSNLDSAEPRAAAGGSADAATGAAVVVDGESDGKEESKLRGRGRREGGRGVSCLRAGGSVACVSSPPTLVLCVKGGVGRDIFGEVYRKLQTYTSRC